MRDLTYQKLHSYSVNNAALCHSSSRCGCFYCLRIFSPINITEHWDSGQTATCPYCHLDTILPSSSGAVITEKLLKGLQQYAWNGHIDNDTYSKEPAIFIELD